MSARTPEWRYIVPPTSCERCGRTYSREEFERKHVDADTQLLDLVYRTWCKSCEDVHMDESEEL